MYLIQQLRKNLFAGISSLLAFTGYGCSWYKSSYQGTPIETNKSSKYEYGRYQPAKVYQVEEFSLSSIGVSVPFSGPATGEFLLTNSQAKNSLPLAPFAMSYAEEVTETLPLTGDQEPKFFTEFPMEISYSIKIKGPKATALVNFGLMDAVPAGSSDTQKQSVHVCNLGSQQIVHPGSSAPNGIAKFTVSLPIPSDCLKSNTSERKMLFVALDPETRYKGLSPAPSPTERGVQISRTTLFRSWIHSKAYDCICAKGMRSLGRWSGNTFLSLLNSSQYTLPFQHRFPRELRHMISVFRCTFCKALMFPPRP